MTINRGSFNLMSVEYKVGETWLANGLLPHERPEVVRIVEILESGNVDVNYNLDESGEKDLRILPYQCLIEKVEQ